MMKRNYGRFGVCRLLFSAALVTLAYGMASAQSGPQGPVTSQKIVDNGSPESRINIVVVGEGYTAAELPQFRTLAASVMSVTDPGIGFFAEEPFKEYKRYFNVYRVDVASLQSGADLLASHVDCNGMAWVAKTVDTAFTCKFTYASPCPDPPPPAPPLNRHSYRSLVGSSYAVNNVVAAALPGVTVDFTLVLVNDDYYGGTGGGTMFVSRAGSIANISGVALHEAGHTIGALGDEYTDGGRCNIPTDEPAIANITKVSSPTAVKWNYWVLPGAPGPLSNPIPSPYNDPSQQLVSTFQGAQNCPAGKYRPTLSSKMYTPQQPFGPVNTEQLVLALYDQVPPIQSFLPAATTLTLAPGATHQFSVATLQPLSHGLSVTWTVNNVQAGTGPLFYWTPSPGTYTVRANVQDATSWVRPAYASEVSQTQTWNVTVGTGTVKLTGMTPSSGSRGTSFIMTLVGTNLTNGVVNFSPSTGIVVSEIDAQLPNQISCRVTIASGAPTGARTVTITTPFGTSNGRTFTVN